MMPGAEVTRWLECKMMQRKLLKQILQQEVTSREKAADSERRERPEPPQPD
jgi:hypothetical protein